MKLNLISELRLLQKTGRKKKKKKHTCCIMWVMVPGEAAGMDLTTTDVWVAVWD